VTRYLTISELVYINGKVVNNPKILAGTQEIRDMTLLDAAAARPAMSAFGEDAYPTLREKVAALFHSLTRNHPFTDGNKRTATIAAIFMFQVNGQRVVWNQEQALPIIVAVAEGRQDPDSLAEWFPLEEVEDSLEPNADRDMMRIQGIIEEQRWLLDELNRQ
jgi:death on curing protein